MSEATKAENPPEKTNSSGLYDRSVADDAAAPKAEDEPAVVESNSSNYGASSVVGEQGDA